MKKISSTVAKHRLKKKKTRREKFLTEMDQVIPWKHLINQIAPLFLTSGRRGHPPMGREKMLRFYFPQQWYSPFDPAAEEALYDMESMRQFAGIMLHGKERDVHGDKAYVSKERNLLNSDPKKRIWCMPTKKPHGEELPKWQKEVNRRLSLLWANAEHPFRVIKCQFGYRRIRYKGLAKNAQQQQTLFSLANLYLARKRLLTTAE